MALYYDTVTGQVLDDGAGSPNMSVDPALTGVGPQADGTYGTPVSAQQENSPSGTAGFPGFTTQQAVDLLKYGVGVVTNQQNFRQMLDYRRFEATNGGLFMQGRPAQLRMANGGSYYSSGMVVMLAAVAFLLLLKR